MLKRIGNSFIYTCFFALVCNIVIELVVRMVSSFDYSPLTPEYINMFPSQTIAYGVDILLYGVIGVAFAGFLFLYEQERIGYIVQSILYFVFTGLVWIPIITFIWQLWRYPEALVCTIIGFVITNIIMMIVGYQTTKKNIKQLNEALKNIESI